MFANKETVLELNGCSIEAYPSNHLDAYRALDNPKFILFEIHFNSLIQLEAKMLALLGDVQK